MKFFVPDWDDRVDPGFDFLTDRFTLDRDPYRDDLYAHEMISPAPYDGVLISRSALGESGPKRELANRLGLRDYLRLPAGVELFGDCGAFGYVSQPIPPYEAAELVDYYDQLKFDYGVSIDHLVVPEYEGERKFRYDLTLRNAEEFLRIYNQSPRRFEPIGAIQGWDTLSYIEAARAAIAMGYRYIALGGLARSPTGLLRDLIAGVMATIPEEVKVHIFGVARTPLLPLFLETGVASADSAAPLRQAWLSASDNYYAPDRTYAAIRIPIADEERARSKYTIVGRSDVGEGGLPRLRAAERVAIDSIRRYDRGDVKLDEAMSALMAYDGLLGERLDGQKAAKRKELYRKTLKDRPWKKCPCPVCRALGVEVIIFRGNNRNRRRGFHNLFVFYQRLKSFGPSLHGVTTHAQLGLGLGVAT